METSILFSKNEEDYELKIQYLKELMEKNFVNLFNVKTEFPSNYTKRYSYHLANNIEHYGINGEIGKYDNESVHLTYKQGNMEIEFTSFNEKSFLESMENVKKIISTIRACDLSA